MTDTETTQSVDQARQVTLTVQLFLHDRAGHPVSRVEIVILFTKFNNVPNRFRNSLFHVQSISKSFSSICPAKFRYRCVRKALKFKQGTKFVRWPISIKFPPWVGCWPTNHKPVLRICFVFLISQYQICGGNLKLICHMQTLLLCKGSKEEASLRVSYFITSACKTQSKFC